MPPKPTSNFVRVNILLTRDQMKQLAHLSLEENKTRAEVATAIVVKALDNNVSLRWQQNKKN